MDVCGVANEKDAADLEMLGDPVVHVVGREPIDTLDVDTHALEDVLAHVVPCKCFLLVFGALAHGADKPRSLGAFHREDTQQISLV